MDYLPIAEHGIIGDLHSIALVGTDGTIDWYCCPRFDSPSVFGAILDKDRGGFYRIAPALDEWTPKQLYLPDTNVLITRFLTPGGVGEVQDFMPIQGGVAAHRHRLIRRVVGVRGEIRFRVDVQPRSNSVAETREAFDATVTYWRRWLAQCRYQGRWREMVMRSALTLKLMTYL